MDPETMDCDDGSESDPQRAEEYKQLGNQAYSRREYREAVQHYSKAIRHDPQKAAYYGNRSAALMMLGQHQAALEDSRISLQLDEGFTKGYLRAAKCHLMMGNPTLSIDWYNKALHFQPGNKQAVEEKQMSELVLKHMQDARTQFDKEEYRTALYHVDRCLTAVPDCVKFRTLKAEVLVMSGRLDDAQIMCNDLLRADSTNTDAIYIKGLCQYYYDDTGKASQLLQRVLRLDPDHTKARQALKRSKTLMAKKEGGNQAYKEGNYKQAYDLYTEALTIDGRSLCANSKLFCNRALMAQKLGDLNQAIADCSQAVELDPRYTRAYQRRANLYQLNSQHEEAVRDLKKVLEFDSSHENKQAVKDAERQLKLSKRKDYYKLLDVDKGACQDDIKRAYLKKAKLHHPDRHVTAEKEVREKEEAKFKDVSEAYSVLSDSGKKYRYDNGLDLEMGGMDIDPSDLLANLFGGMGGGGMPDFMGGMGGGGRRRHHHHNGFHFSTSGPGSFAYQF